MSATTSSSGHPPIKRSVIAQVEAQLKKQKHSKNPFQEMYNEMITSPLETTTQDYMENLEISPSSQWHLREELYVRSRDVHARVEIIQKQLEKLKCQSNEMLFHGPSTKKSSTKGTSRHTSNESEGLIKDQDESISMMSHDRLKECTTRYEQVFRINACRKKACEFQTWTFTSVPELISLENSKVAAHFLGPVNPYQTSEAQSNDRLNIATLMTVPTRQDTLQSIMLLVEAEESKTISDPQDIQSRLRDLQKKIRPFVLEDFITRYNCEENDDHEEDPHGNSLATNKPLQDLLSDPDMMQIEHDENVPSSSQTHPLELSIPDDDREVMTAKESNELTMIEQEEEEEEEETQSQKVQPSVNFLTKARTFYADVIAKSKSKAKAKSSKGKKKPETTNKDPEKHRKSMEEIFGKVKHQILPPMLNRANHIFATSQFGFQKQLKNVPCICHPLEFKKWSLNPNSRQSFLHPEMDDMYAFREALLKHPVWLKPSTSTAAETCADETDTTVADISFQSSTDTVDLEESLIDEHHENLIGSESSDTSHIHSPAESRTAHVRPSTTSISELERRVQRPHKKHKIPQWSTTAQGPISAEIATVCTWLESEIKSTAQSTGISLFRPLAHAARDITHAQRVFVALIFLASEMNQGDQNKDVQIHMMSKLKP